MAFCHCPKEKFKFLLKIFVVKFICLFDEFFFVMDDFFEFSGSVWDIFLKLLLSLTEIFLCFSPSKPVTIARSVGVQVQTEDKIKGRIGIVTLQNHKIGDDFFVKPISQKLPSEKMITNEEMNEKIQNFEIDLNIEKDYSGDLKRICGNSSTNSMVSPPKKSNFFHDLEDLSDISSEEFELELDKKSSEELSSGKRFKCFNTPKRKKKKQVNKVVAKSIDTLHGGEEKT